MLLRPTGLFVASALLAGCVNGSTESTGGAGGAGTTSGGGEICGATQLAEAKLRLVLDGSPVPAESEVFPYEATVEGKVLSSEVGTVVIDTCPPDSQCTNILPKLEVTAPNLPSVVVPPGAWVRLRLHVEQPSNSFRSGTLSNVIIENLPDWMGASNPISSTSRIWFAAFVSEGALGRTPSSVPYQVDEVRCGDCWPPNDKEELSITFPGAPPFSLPPGEQRSFDVTGPLAAHYVFQGLSAARGCESVGSVSYWLIGQ